MFIAPAHVFLCLVKAILGTLQLPCKKNTSAVYKDLYFDRPCCAIWIKTMWYSLILCKLRLKVIKHYFMLCGNLEVVFYPCPTSISLYALCFSSLFKITTYWFGGWEALAISVYEYFVYVPLLLVLKMTTQITSKRREMKKALRRGRIMNWKQ